MNLKNYPKLKDINIFNHENLFQDYRNSLLFLGQLKEKNFHENSLIQYFHIYTDLKDPKEIESRLTITIVCLLSLIAYNFVIDSDMPKLEYLTIMDYIILISYVYAAIPNFLSIYSFQLIKKNKPLAEKYEAIEKRYGLLSYILIIFIIVIVNASSAPEHTNSMFTWAAMKN